MVKKMTKMKIAARHVAEHILSFLRSLLTFTWLHAEEDEEEDDEEEEAEEEEGGEGKGKRYEEEEEECAEPQIAEIEEDYCSEAA
jgi:hypothetical protein